MKKLISLAVILFSVACGEPPILEPGTYNVVVTYEIDKGAFSSLEGTSDNQEWEFTEDTVQFFKGQSKYDYIVDGKSIVVDRENFYMELFPKKNRESFEGEWTSVIPDVMLTVAGVKGKKQ